MTDTKTSPAKRNCDGQPSLAPAGLLGGTNCLECGWPADACDCEPEPWKCPACGGLDTWFDRTIELHPDGTESGMKTRCTKCGRDVDELMPPNAPHEFIHIPTTFCA